MKKYIWSEAMGAKAGEPIELTDEQAEHLLRVGHIALRKPDIKPAIPFEELVVAVEDRAEISDAEPAPPRRGKRGRR